MQFKTGLSSGHWSMAHPDDEARTQRIADTARGHYLCEVCEELMTDDILPAAESPSGLDLAICAPCRVKLRSD